MLRTKLAKFEDLRDVFDLCWDGYEELKDVCPEGCEADLLAKWIHKAWKQAPCVLIEKDGKIIGFWGMCLIRPQWSRKTVLGDYMLYIVPKHRSLKTLKKLLKAGEEQADRLNMPLRLSYLIVGDWKLHARIFMLVGYKITGFLGIYKRK